MTERFRIGIISSVHGIKGEVKVFPTTDEPMRFKKIKEIFLQAQSGKMRDDLHQMLHIEAVKFYKNMVIVQFKELHTIEDARPYLNLELYVDRKDATPLKENENYIADLIGLDVVTDEEMFLGKAIDVFPTGANHVLEVEYHVGETGDVKTVLIPYIKDCILDVDLEHGKILVHLLDGLLDI